MIWVNPSDVSLRVTLPFKAKKRKIDLFPIHLIKSYLKLKRDFIIITLLLPFTVFSLNSHSALFPFTKQNPNQNNNKVMELFIMLKILKTMMINICD